jgi:sec-independent protein translocase protein TatA
MIGMPEMLIIAGIALLIFGPRQLPKMGRALGETIRELRGISKELTKLEDDK